MLRRAASRLQGQRPSAVVLHRRIPPGVARLYSESAQPSADQVLGETNDDLLRLRRHDSPRPKRNGQQRYNVTQMDLNSLKRAVSRKDAKAVSKELQKLETVESLIQQKLHTNAVRVLFEAFLHTKEPEAVKNVVPIKDIVVKILQSGTAIGWMTCLAILHEIGRGNPEEALHVWVTFIETLGDISRVTKDVNKEAAWAGLMAYSALCIKNGVPLEPEACSKLVPIKNFPLDNDLYNMEGSRLIPKPQLTEVISNIRDLRIQILDPSSVEFLKNLPDDKPLELETRYREAQQHAKSVEQPLSATTYSRFIACYAESGRTETAFKVWNDMVADEVVPTIQAWNSLLRAAALSRHNREALLEGVLTQLKDAGIEPDAESYCILMNNQFRHGNPVTALELFDQIQRGEIPNVAVSLKMFNIVLDGLLRIKRIEAAENLLKEGKEMGYIPEVVVANTFIRSYIQAGQYDKATKTFEEMMENGVNPDIVTYGNVIDTVFKLSRAGNYEPDSHVEALIEEMNQRGIRINTVAMTSIISGLIKTSKDIEAARTMFNLMLKKRLKLNGYVFAILIDGELTLGDYDRAMRYFNVMIEHNVMQSTPVHNQFIRWSALRGELSRAHSMFQRLCANTRTKPNKYSYSFILSGCLKHRDREIGQQVIDKLAGEPSSFELGTELPKLLTRASEQGLEVPLFLLEKAKQKHQPEEGREEQE